MVAAAPRGNLVSWHHSRMAGQAMWVVPFRGTNRPKQRSWNLPGNANFAEAPQQRQFIKGRYFGHQNINNNAIFASKNSTDRFYMAYCMT